MTPGFVVAFGGVLAFGLFASAVIFFMTRSARAIAASPAFREADIDASLAAAEVAARRAATEIAKVRASMAH